MKAFWMSATGQLSIGLVLVVAVFAAFVAGGDAGYGLVSAARAVAFSGTVMSFVLPIWWLVTIAQGDPNEVLTICCAIFGTTFIFAVVVLARRG